MTHAQRPDALPDDLPSEALIDLHETAAGWFMRRGEPGWTAADEHALARWLDEAPLHREIFEDMARISVDLHQIPLAHDASWRVPASSITTMVSPARSAAAPRVDRTLGRWVSDIGRRAWVSAAVTACVVLLAGGSYGWYRWDHTPEYVLDLVTAHGEMRTVALPDGSSVMLNIDSTLAVRYYPRRREVVLNQGEAFFQVAADTDRPFTVDSYASRIKVVGTAFNVRATPPKLVVKVLEGKVDVQPDRQASGKQILRMGPGTGLAIDPATGQVTNVPATANTVGDWRTGQIQFQRTPLNEVAQELSRYLAQPVVLASENLASRPISGVLSTTRPEAFLRALPELHPLRVQQTAEGWRIVGY